jgi:hypothetical protein
MAGAFQESLSGVEHYNETSFFHHFRASGNPGILTISYKGFPLDCHAFRVMSHASRVVAMYSAIRAGQ